MRTSKDKFMCDGQIIQMYSKKMLDRMDKRPKTYLFVQLKILSSGTCSNCIYPDGMRTSKDKFICVILQLPECIRKEC